MSDTLVGGRVENTLWEVSYIYIYGRVVVDRGSSEEVVHESVRVAGGG